MFIDRVVVNIEAGTGGSGITSFRREKFVPLGGPDGGDGGRGGDVIVLGDSNLNTLLDYTYRDSWTAERGDHGSGSNKSGRSGADVVLPVPPGTVVRDAETRELLGEVLESGQSIVVARGGRGGKGNAFFATATHQSPREWQPGEDGEKRRLELELKLIADVGLVGQPNAGKSTLLSVISAARPKIADYPFTTLAPNLGVVQLSDSRTFVVATSRGSSRARTRGRASGSSSCATSSARASSPSSSRSTRSTGRRSTTSCATRSGRTRPSWPRSRTSWCSRSSTSWERTTCRRSRPRARGACSR
jgi:GTP-binding protein